MQAGVAWYVSRAGIDAFRRHASVMVTHVETLADDVRGAFECLAALVFGQLHKYTEWFRPSKHARALGWRLFGVGKTAPNPFTPHSLPRRASVSSRAHTTVTPS